MSSDPGRQIGAAVAGHCLELQRLGELVLAARAFEKDHEFSGDRERNARTAIFFDQRQRQVDTSGDARRRVERPIPEEKGIRLNSKVRKALSNSAHMAP